MMDATLGISFNIFPEFFLQTLTSLLHCEIFISFFKTDLITGDLQVKQISSVIINGTHLHNTFFTHSKNLENLQKPQSFARLLKKTFLIVEVCSIA